MNIKFDKLFIFRHRVNLVAAICFYALQSIFGIAVASESGFIGLNVQANSPEIANSLGIKDSFGVFVRDVAMGGPGAIAGFRRGDLILKFDEKNIENFEDLLKAVKQITIGQEVPVLVLRELKEIRLTLVPASWPDGLQIKKGEVAAMPELGLSLASMTKKVRESFQIRWGAMGVLISLVDPAIRPNIALQRGDIVVQINQKDVWKPKQVLDAYEKAKKLKNKNLLLLVERGRSFRFMLLPTPITKPKD